MSLILSLFSANVSDLVNPKKWLVDWAIGGSRVKSGEYVSPQSAMTFSAYYACVRVIAEDCAKLPLKVYRNMTPRGKQELPEHPVYEIIHDQANPEMSAFAFRETMTAWAESWGNAYAWIEYDNFGEVTALWPIHPSLVEIRRDENGNIYYHIRYQNGGKKIEGNFSAEFIFHLHGLGDDGIMGYPIVRLARESIGLGLASEAFGASFFGNGAALAGVVYHPGALTEEQKKQWREDFSQLYVTSGEKYKTALLEAGTKYERIGIPPEEGQFLETRQHQVEEICRWFRVPPHKIQHLLRATFSNIEHQAIEYVGDALLPWLIRWEHEIWRKLLNGSDDSGLYAKHVVNGLLRGDSTQRAAFYTSLFAMGALSPNDILELEDRNPVEGGDARFIPLNLQRLEAASEEPEEEEEDLEENDLEEEDDQSEEDDGEGEDGDGEAEPGDLPSMPMDQPEPEDLGGGKIPRHERALTALRPVLLEAAGRAIIRETRAIQAAAKKHGQNLEAFRLWLEGYLSSAHEESIRTTLAGPVAALCDLLGLPPWRPGPAVANHVGCLRWEVLRQFERRTLLEEASGPEIMEKQSENLITEVLKEIHCG